ncbi:hypothetical protein DERF_004891 [Dermatophagoides farinae]|uniref:UDP-glycosyltransferase n=1 Tax=Dermatophagoides farinae TaxID=6954 RepID=A0A922I4T6_DERFA|nr:hypothetical protein HUG17_7806 [Dermatophagoides farinae]KAH9521218.1 hypothetical protein DERF_004891 [Dermatophagoides farinae]
MAIIMFMANDFVGPQNACIGLAQSLSQRGHRVYFCLRREFFARFISNGFDEQNLLELTGSTAKKKESLRFLVEKIREFGFATGISPLEKVRQIKRVNLVKSTFEDPLGQFDGQLRDYLQRINPDLIVYDGEVIPPAILYWPNCPWIYLFCSNPIGLFDSDLLPPFLSDFNTIDIDNEPPSCWQEFRSVLDECYYNLVRQTQSRLCRQLSYPDPNDFEWMKKNRFFIRSPHLNLYQYPQELDYNDRIYIPNDLYCRVDSFSRHEYLDTNRKQELLEQIKHRNGSGKLIYLSLGTMGACNLELMARLIRILSMTEHTYILSTGPANGELELGANMWAQSYLPQIWIFANLNVDLAIIHGGNNSLCEAFSYGIPCLVMPLFYDQFLNARRVQEKQLGARIDTFNFEDVELVNCINTLLDDDQLKQRVQSIGQRIRKEDSKLACCKRLEELIIRFKKEKSFAI